MLGAGSVRRWVWGAVRPVVGGYHIEKRPVRGREGKASLECRGPDHRDVPHRLALRSGGNDTNIAADNPVERDPGKVRHSRFELVFVGCDQSDPFAFAEEPSGARGYHAYRQVQIGRAHVLTPVTNAHLVCRLLLDKKKPQHTIPTSDT